jgi:hypothetical protein
MTLRVEVVPSEFLNITWPKVEKYIAAAVEYSNGMLSVEEVKVRVLDGAWTLIVAIDDSDIIQGAAVVSFFNRTDNRVAYVTSIGGRLISNKKAFSQLRDLLKKYGATCIEGTTRDSTLRLWERIGARKQSNYIQITL